MSAYVSMYRQIRDALVTILSNLQADFGNGNEAVFKLATDDVSKEFNQEPFALVTTLPGEDIKVEVGTQDRNYNYVVFIVLNLENKIRSRKKTDDLMLDLIELSLDALDEADWTGLLHQLNSNIQDWILNAKKFETFVAEGKSSSVLIGTIDVDVSWQKDL